jgi:serine/threonine protein phosphatase PrpC
MSFLKNIFGKEAGSSPDRAATAPLEPSTLAKQGISEGRQHVSVGAAHSAGLERSHDDDSLLILTGGSDGHNGLLDFGLFCVADGLGGHERGDIASSVAVRAVARRLTQGALLRVFELESSEEDQPLDDLVRQAFKEANSVVLERAVGGATTLTAALLLGEQLMIGHVGDTRAYFVDGEKVEVLTTDHSLVHQLIATGAISEEEAVESPHRSVLWNAMGKSEDIQVDVLSQRVLHGGYLLLCSDGLWGDVSDEEIQRIVCDADDPQYACNELVGAAIRAGGSDNITTILVHFP